MEEPQGGQDQAPDQSAQAPAAPAQTEVPATGEAVASQDTGAPTLPRTGSDTAFFMVMGATMLLAGTTIRRLAS